MTQRPIIAVTVGDVAGIGSEIVLQAVQDTRVLNCCQPVVIGHPEILARAEKLRPTVGKLTYVVLPEISTSQRQMESVLAALPPGNVPVINPCDDGVLAARPGVVSAAAGDAAFQCLAAAVQLALAKAVHGIATAPLNKEALRLAGHNFPGHTEILADQCGVDDFAMMLHLPESSLQPLRHLISSKETGTKIGGHGLSIVHVTLHTSIASVHELLTQQSIVAKTILMRNFLQRLGSRRQSIAVTALNPHAGESGLFGNEEATLISPAVAVARRHGCDVTGPLPADTLFRRAVSGEFDGVVAMYHDQGHIPIKLIGFDSAINITLGLPFVRTSPTHGTAFDRAWNPTTTVDPRGMIDSVITAAEFSQLPRFA